MSLRGLVRFVPAIAVLGAALGLVAWGGGSSDPRRAPAPPVILDAPSGAGHDAVAAGPIVDAGRAGESFAVEGVLRLVDALASAKIDAPRLAEGRTRLDKHWRKMPFPWGHPSAAAEGIAWRVALGAEHWTAEALDAGDARSDPKTYNRTEGTYDDRDALFAPAPATFAFPCRVPAEASLEVSTAVLDPVATRFDVVVVEGDGRATSACSWTEDGAPGWHPRTCSLAAWAGQSVTLRLSTNAGSVAPALWGEPVVVARRPPKVPYNVLWIVVDALRPDAIAAFHDDAEDKRIAAKEPLEAWLPKMPGLTPAIDALAAKGVRFTRAYSTGGWTRPGTLSMLAGARTTELGIDPTPWILPAAVTERFYASDPPLLPLTLGRAGALTQAIVNNYFMVGHAAIGLEMGFAGMVDHRHDTRDTEQITTTTLDWLRHHADRRFFLFCNFVSPHSPYEPPEEFLRRVPAAPLGPADAKVRAYAGEVAKDDAAVGAILHALDELHLRERTLVVITADHGETLSSAHGGVGVDTAVVRFGHIASAFEENGRIPILLSLPGTLPEGLAVSERVRNIDIAPTVLDLEGLGHDARASGSSLLGLMRGAREPERPVVIEGRGLRGLLRGRYHLIARDAEARTSYKAGVGSTRANDLFDLEVDPGERHDIAPNKPEIVRAMRAELDRAYDHVDPIATGGIRPPIVQLRFAGAGGVHRVSGRITVSGDGTGLTVSAQGIPPETIKTEASRIEFSLATQPGEVVGIDVRLDPTSVPLAWELFLDGKPWPVDRVFVGPFGIADAGFAHGVPNEAGWATAFAASTPPVDAPSELGVFVTVSRSVAAAASAPSSAAAKTQSNSEVDRLMKQWGYAQPSNDKAH